MNDFDLAAATGLEPQELAEVLQSNPRAYMAVRGAVAEKHLEKIIRGLHAAGEITGFRSASGDSDKDFYIEYEGSTLSLECKNVEVIKTSTKAMQVAYLKYLGDSGHLGKDRLKEVFESVDLTVDNIEAYSGKKIKQAFSALPQPLRESGIAKYEFSSALVKESHVGKVEDKEFVEQFGAFPLTIDFQRTRNSTDDDGDNRRNRYYKVGEIDLVGACLFSRTMQWKFVFAPVDGFKVHEKYNDRYSNKLILLPGVWRSNLAELLDDMP